VDPVALGVILLVLGIMVTLLTWFILRVLARTRRTPLDSPFSLGLAVDLEQHQDAVLTIEPGGRILFCNGRARDWFALGNREPSLEILSRHVRPSQALLNLCAGEGQARFMLGGRPIEATSYSLPSVEYGHLMLVVLRRQAVTALTAEDGSQAGQALNVFTELSQKMAASLDLQTTLDAILESVDRLVPSDFSEITIYDAVNQELVPYRFVGLAGVDRHMERTSDRYKPGEGYSGYLVVHKKPLVVLDVDAPNDVHPFLDRSKYPFRSYLGVPLLAGNELVGTLELASFNRGRFSETDRETLVLLAGQAAVALHNAILFEQEQLRAHELAGLARLVQATSSISEPEYLISRLVESLRALFQVDRLGFLLYDENRRVLLCQAPFVGIPQEVVSLYQIPVPEGSPADHILKSQDMVIAAHAPSHPALETLGMNQVAEAAGMRDTILVPLTSAGRFLGYLQVANKISGEPFADDDIRLLAIVAGQIGPLLGNASLLQETRRRALRSEALRRISNLAGSAATLDEILKFSLKELQRMMDADIAVIYLLDEQVGDLKVHSPSMIGIEGDDTLSWSRVTVDAPEFRQTITSTQQNYLSGSSPNDKNLPPYLKELVTRLRIQALIDVPLIVRDRGVGELLLASRAVDGFNQADLVFAATSAGQLAGAIERSILYSQTDEKLRRRVEELTSLTMISREISATRDLEHLLRRVFEEAQRTTGADGGRTLLLDPLRLESKQLSLAIGERTDLPLDQLEELVIESRQALLVDNFATYGQPPLEPEMKSAIIAPVLYEGQCRGVLHLWSRKPEHFDVVALEIIQALSVQASLGLGNALNYQAQVYQNELLERRVETLARLMESSRALQLSESLETAMRAIADAIREATPFNAVLVSVYEAEKGVLRRMAGAGFTQEQFQDVRHFTQPWRSIKEYLKPEYRFGDCYFIPTELRPVDPPDVHTVYVMQQQEAVEDREKWHPDDLLIVPLLDANGEPLGLISVDDPQNGLRPDRSTFESLELFASQAVLTVESHQALRKIETQLADARQRMDRSEKSAAAAQIHLPVLLKKDLEQTLNVHKLSMRTRRIEAGLEIARLVDQQMTREEVLETLGRQLLTRFGMDTALIAEAGESGPRLLATLGSLPDETSLNALLGQRNPLRNSLQTNKLLLVADLPANSEWQESTLLQVLGAASFICFPIKGERSAEAAVLAVSQTPQEAFTGDDEELFGMIATQASQALAGIRLVEETSQRLMEVNLLLAFSRELGSLDQSAILDSLIETALKVAQNAQGGAVLLWNPQLQQLAARAAQGYTQSDLLLGIVYPLEGSLPGRAFQERRTLRIDEVNFAQDYNLGREDLLSYRDATQGKLPVSSLLVPIQSGEQPLGVLVLDDFRSAAGFSLEDQALIDSLAQQTALALENARLFQASEQRAHQLQALTEISGEMSSSLQTEELIAGLLSKLRSLATFDTGTLWLRYGDQLTVRAAEGFEDLENRVGLTVETKDSQLLREMITTGKPIVVGNVHEDERFPSLVESIYASWLGLPLIAKGDVIGVIALEKLEAGFYTAEGVQLLTAFASQAAVSLQNATLFDDSLRRAIELDEQTQRLASLNRYSTSLSSSLDIGQILKTIIAEIQRQISCSSISIVLFDRAGRGSVWAEAPQALSEMPYLLPDAPLFDYLRQAQGVFNCEDITQEAELEPLHAYLALHNTRSMLTVSLATGSDLQGLVMIHEKRRTRRFTSEEIELARTIASQAAISVQNAQLYEETQLRLNELAAINRISQNISATIDLEELFALLPEQLSAIVNTENLYLALYDVEHNLTSFPLAYDRGEQVFLEAQAPAGLTGHILQTREPLLLVGPDIEAQMEALGAPLYGDLPPSSYLGIPLMVGEQVIGVLAVQTPDEAQAYSAEDVRLVSTVAAQIAVAIENSRLYTETRRRSADLALLFDYSTSIANVLDENRLVDTTFEHLQNAFGVELVAVVRHTESGAWSAILQERKKRRTVEIQPVDGNLYARVVQSGLALFVRQPEQAFDPPHDFGFETSLQAGSWVGVPLTARGETFGVLSLVGSQPGQFGDEQLQLISQIGNQLSTALDGAQLFAQVQDYASELEERVTERTQQLALEHNRTQTLLRIITELSASLDMDIVLNRTLGLINQIVGAEQSTILLVEAGEQTLLRRASFGYAKPAPEGGEHLAMRADEGLAGWVIQQHQGVLIPDVRQDERWIRSPGDKSEHRSALVVPLMVGEEALGALLLFHRQPDHFSADHLDLVQATAKQIAVAINNSKLYRLIRDQAERLGDMLRTQHIEMSRSQAILEAVADGVLVTDNVGQVSLFNDSAERILKMSRDQVQSKPLESFIGLFGKAARSWMETIRTWSRNPDSYREGDVYAEKIELDDGRVVLVHLSPVRLRNELLGTVSIFRDITHEVEVDRLKSEFVANVSHELRTPMTSIKGYVDILLMGASGELNEQQRNFLNVVKSNTERLVVLVNDLLEVSRLEAGKINLSLEPVDLRAMAGDVVHELQQRSTREQRPMQVVLESLPELPRVFADPERVRQIIDNLVDNAYHYTPGGGRITVRLSQVKREVQVDVIDNGVGIPLGDQELVFDRFYRGEDPLVLETPGTGLGLAVVKTLVEMHKGRIWVYSTGRAGDGSVFSFTLPVVSGEILEITETSLAGSR
jgi:PAS domain S-box-containing protein